MKGYPFIEQIEFKIPLTTQRDRVNNTEPLLSQIEKAKLVKHLQDLASVGYGYTRDEIVSITTD